MVSVLSSGEQSHRWAAGGDRVRGRFTVLKASFSEYLSARKDWVQDIWGYYTRSLPPWDDNAHIREKNWLGKLNGSRQESRNRHFNWNFEVCQNPPKLCEPTCVIWKDVPLPFLKLKSRKKRLDKQAWSSLSTPQLLLSSWKMLNLDTRDMRNPMLHGKKQWGGEREL